MARRKTHKDVEFFVGNRVFSTFDKAAADAVVQSLSVGKKVMLDVVVWSRAGAKWLEGDDGVERYKEDPDASVFERIEINANSQGRVA